MTTIAQFIAQHGITASIVSIARRTDGVDSFGSDCSHFRVTFRKAGTASRFTVQFSQGSGHNGKTPKAEDVLDCVASDVQGIEGRTFADWCSDFGMETDARQRRTFKMIEAQRAKLHAILGGDMLATLMECERL